MSTTPPVEPRKHRFSVDEYHRLGEMGVFKEGDRVELIDGEIFEMTPIGTRHMGHVNHLTRLLYAKVADQATISVQNPVRLGDQSEPEPDVAVLHHRADAYASEMPGPDDILLLIEVADTSVRYDRDVKIPLYAHHGVAVVWLVDVENDAVEIYEQPVDGNYTVIRRPPPSAHITLESLPAVDFQVAKLFV
jgi:Uma2 family endonuclease